MMPLLVAVLVLYVGVATFQAGFMLGGTNRAGSVVWLLSAVWPLHWLFIAGSELGYKVSGGVPDVVTTDSGHAWAKGCRFYRLVGRNRLRVYVALPPAKNGSSSLAPGMDNA